MGQLGVSRKEFEDEIEELKNESPINRIAEENEVLKEDNAQILMNNAMLQIDIENIKNDNAEMLLLIAMMGGM